MPPAASSGGSLQRREGGGVCTLAKSFKAIVGSREDTEATPDCTNFSWDPPQGKSVGTCRELTESHLNRGSPREKAEPGPLASDAEMLDLEPACLLDRDGAVSGCRCPGSRARETKEAPEKEVSDKNADRQIERWTGLLPSQTPPCLPGQTDGPFLRLSRLMPPSYQLWRQESVIFSPCLYCSGLICL